MLANYAHKWHIMSMAPIRSPYINVSDWRWAQAHENACIAMDTDEPEESDIEFELERMKEAV
jgi:hypothetical protein